MKRSLLIVCILIFSLLACGCLGSNSDSLPSSKYVAIYEQCINDGSIINGTGNVSNVINIPSTAPGEPFDYNQSWGFQSLKINDSFKFVYGCRIIYEDPGSYNNSLVVNSVYGYPYTLKSGLTILAVFKNGSIQAVYNNESLFIEPGKSWTSENVSQQIVNKQLPTVDRNAPILDITYMPFTVQYITSYTVENLGIYNK